MDNETLNNRIDAVFRQSGGCITLILSLAVCLGGGYVAWEQKNWTMLTLLESVGLFTIVWSIGQMRE